jgi:hypothetical protein
VFPFEIGSHYRTVIGLEIAHVGPVQMSRRRVDGYAVRQFSSLLYDDFQIRAVWINRHYSARPGIEEKEAARYGAMKHVSGLLFE